MPDILSLMVTADHPVPVEPLGGLATVSVKSGSSVFWASTPNVSATQNLGTIVAGGAQTFASQMWIRSASLSAVTVTASPPVAPSDQSDPARVIFTPEQYGAVGDGVTDDTVAFQTMFASGGKGERPAGRTPSRRLM